jgi:hypothetical protein
MNKPINTLVMPRESGASSNHCAKDGYIIAPNLTEVGYWIARSSRAMTLN